MSKSRDENRETAAQKCREAGNSICNRETWIGEAQHREIRGLGFFSETGKSGKKSGEKMGTMDEAE